MTQTDKELLLKDLCARLPYGVICEDGYGNVLEVHSIDKPNTIIFRCSDNDFCTSDLDKCKLYLFPLSSMTGEQKREYVHIATMCGNIASSQLTGMTIQDWFNKNHFDYRGMIEKGLAIDATGLNIY